MAFGRMHTLDKYTKLWYYIYIKQKIGGVDMTNPTTDKLQKELQREKEHLKKLMADSVGLGITAKLGEGVTLQTPTHHVNYNETTQQVEEYAEPNTTTTNPSLMDKVRGKAASVIAPIYQQKIAASQKRIAELEGQLGLVQQTDEPTL